MSTNSINLAIIEGHAAELISQITLAIKLDATAAQLTEIIFAHPTLSEAVLEATEKFFDNAPYTQSVDEKYRLLRP